MTVNIDDNVSVNRLDMCSGSGSLNFEFHNIYNNMIIIIVIIIIIRIFQQDKSFNKSIAGFNACLKEKKRKC